MGSRTPVQWSSSYRSTSVAGLSRRHVAGLAGDAWHPSTIRLLRQRRRTAVPSLGYKVLGEPPAVLRSSSYERLSGEPLGGLVGDGTVCAVSWFAPFNVSELDGSHSSLQHPLSNALRSHGVDGESRTRTHKLRQGLSLLGLPVPPRRRDFQSKGHGVPESNRPTPRSQAPHSAAHPLPANRRPLVERTGLEPATPSVQARCSSR